MRVSDQLLRRAVATGCIACLLLGGVPAPLVAQEAPAEDVAAVSAAVPAADEAAAPASALPSAELAAAPTSAAEPDAAEAATSAAPATPDASAGPAAAPAELHPTVADAPEGAELPVPAAERGWVSDGATKRYLLEDGSFARGIQAVDGTLYVFDLDTGALLGAGWHKLGDVWCHADAQGRAHTGWLHDEKRWYWLDDAGVMAAGGLREIDGTTYCFTVSGVMCTGWTKRDGAWRYFDARGALVTGWLRDQGTWYWLDADGVMAAGCLREIGGKTYCFDASGALRTGWARIDGAWWYFDSSGAAHAGWLKVGSTWYYLRADHRMATGWLDLGGTWYYLEPSGAMAVGLRNVDGKPYCFADSGAMSKGWVSAGGLWYHMQDWNTPTKGWYSEGGVTYWFDANGVMATGWRTIDGIDRWFSPSGACDKLGWQNPHGLYVVSTYSVKPYKVTTGIFSYITPSRVQAYSTRADCVEILVQRAYEYLGTPYVWDYACAPGVGVDCAGLVMQCLCAIGMNTPYNPWSHYYDPWQDHNANNMFADDGFMWVDAADRQRGDIVFWPGHCALYLGGDQCIEAWSSTGVVQSSIWQNPSGGWRTPSGYRRICV